VSIVARNDSLVMGDCDTRVMSRHYSDRSASRGLKPACRKWWSVVKASRILSSWAFFRNPNIAQEECWVAAVPEAGLRMVTALHRVVNRPGILHTRLKPKKCVMRDPFLFPCQSGNAPMVCRSDSVVTPSRTLAKPTSSTVCRPRFLKWRRKDCSSVCDRMSS